MVLQLVVSGLAAGSLYAMASLGIVIIFKTTRVPNFAHGEMGMFGTFIAFSLVTGFFAGVKLPVWLAVLVAMAFAAALGIVVEWMVIRPMKGAPELNALIATLGVNIALNNGAGLIWGHQSKRFPTIFEGDPLNLGGLILARDHLGLMVIGLILALGSGLYFRYTRSGAAMRAVAQNAEVASLFGVRVSRVRLLVWSGGAVTAALAGVLVAPVTFMDTQLMESFIVKALTGAILGGMQSLPGAFLGGLLVGVIENLSAVYLSVHFRDALTLLIILLVLVVRPQGLLGKSIPRKV